MGAKYAIKSVIKGAAHNIYREANRCANFLAKLGLTIVSDYVELPSPPVDLLHILEEDACGMAVNRLCPVSLFSV